VAAASSALCGGFRFGERDVVDHTVVLPKAADRVRAARLANLLVRAFLASVPSVVHTPGARSLLLTFAFRRYFPPFFGFEILCSF